MSKLNSILLCVIATFCIAGTVIQAPTINDLSALYSKSAPLVVHIQGNRIFEMLPGVVVERDAYASGFIIDSSKGWIVTAHHVDILEKKKIILPSGKIVSCETVAEDKENDIAIVKVAPLLLKNCKEAELSKKSRIGETIYSVSFSAGFDSIITSGLLSSGISHKNFKEYTYPDGFYISDMYSSGGGSGSPAFNLEGKVVGLLSATYDGFTLIVPAASIQNLINSIN